MSSTGSRAEAPASYHIGWCVLAAGISQAPLVITGIVMMQKLPALGKALLLLSTPTAIILLAGGVGLILRKFFGYYCVYLATFFGGLSFGGLKISYIPFIQRWIRLGPATEDLFLLLNLLLVGILVWEHLKLLRNLDPLSQRTHRVAIASLMVLGAASVLFGRSMIQRDKGRVQDASYLPFVGAEFKDFKTSTSVQFISVYTKPQRGLIMVFAGKSAENSVVELATAHKLKPMTEPAAQKKFLPQVKAWNLNPAHFPSQFAPDDLYYVGRLKHAPKASFQLIYRKSDGFFTGQIFGHIPQL